MATEKRRRRIYLPGWTVRSLIVVALGVMLGFGFVLGDIWLWVLIYGR